MIMVLGVQRGDLFGAVAPAISQVLFQILVGIPGLAFGRKPHRKGAPAEGPTGLNPERKEPGGPPWALLPVCLLPRLGNRLLLGPV